MLKVALIGCGFMGCMHAGCYKNIKNVELAAVADVRYEKAAAAAEGTSAKIFADGKDLIAEGGFDIIDICLPTHLHAEYAMLAMEKAPYVFVEKPVALTAEEADAMIKKAAETGARVQVGQVMRFWDEYTVLTGIIKSGKYGKIINANFRRISPVPTWGWDGWLLDANRSGGAAQDLHIHDVDYVLSVLGEPKRYCSAKNKIGERNAYIASLFTYDDCVVSLEGTWDLPGSYPFTAGFRVVFEKATVEYAAGKLFLYDENGVSEIAIEKKAVEGEGYEGGNISDLGPYFNEILYFCDRCAAGEEIGIATLAEGTASLKFVLKEIAADA